MRKSWLWLGAIVGGCAAFTACVGDTTTSNTDGGGKDATSSGDSGDGSSGTCTTGQYQCQGALLQECQQGQYTTIKTCPTTELCQAHVGAQCGTAACNDGDMQCVDAGLQTCNAGRTGYDTVAICASAALCRTDAGVDGGCIPPTCRPGELSCNQPNVGCPTSDDCVVVCNANLNGWVVSQDCGFGNGLYCCGPYNDGGSAYCISTGTCP